MDAQISAYTCCAILVFSTFGDRIRLDTFRDCCSNILVESHNWFRLIEDGVS